MQEKDEERKSKTVIITGGTKGLGRAMAIACARRHYNLILNYKSDETAAFETLRVCREIHPQVHLIQADVTQRSEVALLMEKTDAIFHSIDVLINNAGINRDRSLQDMREEDWDQVVDTNMKGVFLCAQTVAPYMLRQGHEGIIVNVSAPTAVRGRKNGLNYCASKAGVLVMTKCLALELAPQIRVNCIIPGSIWTEETASRYSYHDPQQRQAKEAQIPLQRIGTPEEVADVVLFLLSPEARYINGQSIGIDGGQFML